MIHFKKYVICVLYVYFLKKIDHVYFLLFLQIKVWNRYCQINNKLKFSQTADKTIIFCPETSGCWNLKNFTLGKKLSSFTWSNNQGKILQKWKRDFSFRTIQD